MLDVKASMALNHHPLNNLFDLVQIHEPYQIQWESRLDDAAALRRKENLKWQGLVDFQIMRLKIEIDDQLAWKTR